MSVCVPFLRHEVSRCVHEMNSLFSCHRIPTASRNTLSEQRHRRSTGKATQSRVWRQMQSHWSLLMRGSAHSPASYRRCKRFYICIRFPELFLPFEGAGNPFPARVVFMSFLFLAQSSCCSRSPVRIRMREHGFDASCASAGPRAWS